ncbi:MAG: hypothetical protein JSU72_19760 [Deltaproteobacteria bacterium]|nr:MAG: hypothetical protein JSU72_19760 [Deltaproteobacteria bacterium]
MPEPCTRLPHHLNPGKALRVGLISNPLSGGNRKGLQAIRDLLVRHPQVFHLETTTPLDVGEALAELSRRQAEVVVVNGGDGTVHSVLTEFYHRPWPGQSPVLALLRAGTASMIARDVGLSGSRRAALKRLLNWVSSGQGRAVVIQRPILKVEGAHDQKPLYGMFFGAAGICQGIRYCLDRVHTKGVGGQLAAGVTLARLLVASARGDRRLLFPVPVSVGLDGGSQEEREFLLILVSTLERLFLGIRPYWGTEIAPLYYTALTFHPRHLLKTAPTLLCGKKSRFGTPEHGYHSHKIQAARLTFNGDFTLDGELYTPDARSNPITVTEGGKASFLKL